MSDFSALFKFIHFLILFNSYNAEPVTFIIGAGVITTGIILSYQPRLLCPFTECCVPHSKWLPLDLTKLEDDLNRNVYGQPFVKSVLLPHIKSHVTNNNPSRALLLSLNGMPGTGKNFVSNIIATSLFKEGKKSKNVHVFQSSIDFLFENKVDEYKKNLQEKIFTAVKQCPHSLFIFDEVHDMPGDLLDSIKPFVDSKETVNGVDFRKTIFILQSKSGGKDINDKFIKAAVEGRTRDELTAWEMEEVLEKNLFKMKNDGFRNSKLIQHGLISGFVPFLPLQLEHVVSCVKSLLRNKGRNNNQALINQVTKSLDFQTANGIQIATYGCKKIKEKLNRILEEP